MSRKDAIKDLYASTASGEKLAMANFSPVKSERPAERVLAGPVRTMGLALDRLEHESKVLQEALSTGATVVELDPDLLDPSFVRDRLAETADEFELFKRSIEENGQEVPILVRPHPTQQGRFQIAFGHRRCRACAALERPVRSVVREMSDQELVLAQGIENSARKDLSYVERALYASRLEERGFERTTICVVLSTDKGELSKLISVVRSIPEALIEAIGPAPKAGRRRWLALSDALAESRAKRAAEKVMKDPSFEKATSDSRFQIILSSALGSKQRRPEPKIWKSSSSPASATLTRGSNTTNLVFDRNTEPEFAEFVASKLDDLYQKFQTQTKVGD